MPQMTRYQGQSGTLLLGLWPLRQYPRVAEANLRPASHQERSKITVAGPASFALALAVKRQAKSNGSSRKENPYSLEFLCNTFVLVLTGFGVSTPLFRAE